MHPSDSSYLVLGQDLNTPRFFNLQIKQIVSLGFRTDDAHTNLPARGFAFKNLLARILALQIFPLVVLLYGLVRP